MTMMPDIIEKNDDLAITINDTTPWNTDLIMNTVDPPLEIVSFCNLFFFF